MYDFMLKSNERGWRKDGGILEIRDAEQGSAVKIVGVKDFYLPHIFECGQCFRWNRQEDGSYIGVAKGKILHIEQREDELILHNSSIDDFHTIWMPYFDLARDYGRIKKILSQENEILKEAVAYGWGMRILKQDIWEMLISFIISANRSMRMIQKSITLLCEKYGEYIGIYQGQRYYDFPKAEVLMRQSPETIRNVTRVGYRSPYIVGTAKMVAEGKIDLCQLESLSTKDARRELMRLPGVGPKVADCILLFALGKQDAFPVDVWIRRAMENLYFAGKETPPKQLCRYGEEKFGDLAGFAQQYLFYYVRDLKVW